MARLVPDDVAEPNQGPWHASERATLNRLAVGLSDDYTVFHGIHWARIDQASPVYGEIDFIVMNRYGRLLAIEQKDAPVTVVRNDLVVKYPSENKPKSVMTQVSRNLNALRQEFSRKHHGRNLVVDHLLYLPESTIRGELPAGVDPSRVVDQTRADQLIDVIQDLFDADLMPSGDRLADALEVSNYLAQRFHASPHIGLLGERAKTFSSRLSSGLATWAARLDMSPFRLHVQGTAGSGKTQLALDELRRAAARGQKSLYVCYNRPLADAMKQSAPDGSRVVTLHEMGREFLEGMGQSVDFSQADVFDRMANAVVEYAPALKGEFGTIVVDEAQDFEPRWIQALIAMAHEQTRMTVLEDPAQRLYDRSPIDLPGWVVMKSPVNYRSPRAIVDYINALQLTDEPIEWGGAVIGVEPRVYEYDPGALLTATELAVADLVEEGFSPEQIVVLTLSGVGSSELFKLPTDEPIGPYRLKRSIGFDHEGLPICSDGNILLETVYRFKGRAADAVVLVGDISDLRDRTDRNKLFVGMTRGRLEVSCVMPSSAAGGGN